MAYHLGNVRISSLILNPLIPTIKYIYHLQRSNSYQYESYWNHMSMSTLTAFGFLLRLPEYRNNSYVRSVLQSMLGVNDINYINNQSNWRNNPQIHLWNYLKHLQISMPIVLFCFLFFQIKTKSTFFAEENELRWNISLCSLYRLYVSDSVF